MSASIWDRHENNTDTAPRYCPHCGEELAHPDNLRENEGIGAVGRRSAYREHRQAHFGWGIDPAERFRDGDPYLADYYDGVEQDSGPTLDRDEEVAGVFDVEINFKARATARVVAANESQAKEKAERLRLNNEECVGGWVPEATITHSLHETAREVRSLTRGEIADSEDIDEEDDGTNYADRLVGWPW